ncbi:MAG TPA: hypothetical protein VH307_26075 [Streptosporangiaceae bacterium]|jgi:hypothetical protein|nr:hypothetical protein [Streptosporangiaceae bacterium]
MYTTITSALAEEHVRNLRAQAASDGRARQARRERRARGGSQVRHGITARRLSVRHA